MNMRSSGVYKFILIVSAVLAVMCVPCAQTVMAQCAMCRAAVAGGSNGAAFAKSFNTAVLVLLAPPVTIFCSIFIVAYRHRKARQDSMPEEDFDDEQS
jgi:ABC-type phosphate transport system permease subunit